MKLSLGRMPLKGNIAFLLVGILFLADVTAVSIELPNETTAATITPTVANTSEEGAFGKESTLDNYNLEANESEIDSRKVSLTDLDDSLDDIEAILPDQEELDSLQDNRTEKINKDQGTPLRESTNISEASMVENEIFTDLDASDELGEDVDPFSSFVKRAAEEKDPEADTVNEDDFSFSDLPQIFEPLIKAFSGSPESEPPPPEDFFSWFPSLKDLLESPKEDHVVAEPTGSPGDGITQPDSSALPTSAEPSLQIAPALPSAQPAKPESLPSPSLLEELSSSVAPTLPEPPLISKPSLSDVPDPEERND